MDFIDELYYDCYDIINENSEEIERGLQEKILRFNWLDDEGIKWLAKFLRIGILNELNNNPELYKKYLTDEQKEIVGQFQVSREMDLFKEWLNNL